MANILPKSNKSADWIAAADAKRQEIADEARGSGLARIIPSMRPVIGGKSTKDMPINQMSEKELMLRNKGMELKRAEEAAKPGSFKHGGVVRKTGMALVHKGEQVLTAKERKSLRKSVRKSGR